MNPNPPHAPYSVVRIMIGPDGRSRRSDWMISAQRSRWQAGDVAPDLKHVQYSIPITQVIAVLHKLLYEFDPFTSSIVHVNGRLVTSGTEAEEVTRTYLPPAVE